MPVLSAFTPLEMLELSAEDSVAERIYRALVANLNGRVKNFSLDGHTGAKLFATAMGLGRVFMAIRRLEENLDPETVYELLRAREAEYSITPLPGATLQERQLALEAAMLAGLAGTYGNLVQALADTLGDDFHSYIPTAQADAVQTPSDPATGPGHWAAADAPRVLGRLLSAISTGLDGSTQTVYYTALDGSAPTTRLQGGMRVVVEPEIDGIAERVLIQAASTSGQASFTAAFTKPHTAGAILTTQPWPYWLNSKLFSFVRLTPEAALDPEKRRKAHTVMARMAQGVSTWGVVGSVGPFTLDDPDLGILNSTPIGEL
jgi:hypothetical protein